MSNVFQTEHARPERGANGNTSTPADVRHLVGERNANNNEPNRYQFLRSGRLLGGHLGL